MGDHINPSIANTIKAEEKYGHSEIVEVILEKNDIDTNDFAANNVKQSATYYSPSEDHVPDITLEMFGDDMPAGSEHPQENIDDEIDSDEENEKKIKKKNLRKSKANSKSKAHSEKSKSKKIETNDKDTKALNNKKGKLNATKNMDNLGNSSETKKDVNTEMGVEEEWYEESEESSKHITEDIPQSVRRKKKQTHSKKKAEQEPSGIMQKKKRQGSKVKLQNETKSKNITQVEESSKATQISQTKKKRTDFMELLNEELLEEEILEEEILEEDDGRKKKKKTPRKSKSQDMREKKKRRYHLEGSEEEEEEDFSSFSSDDLYFYDVSYEDEDEQLMGKYVEKHKKIRKKDFFGDKDESSSISSDVPSYIQNEDESEEPEVDFFEILGSIPDIEDMTYTSSEAVISEHPKQELVKTEPIEEVVILKPYLDDSDIETPSEKIYEYEDEVEGEISEEPTETTATTTDSLDLWELDHLPRYSEDISPIAVTFKTDEEDALKELFEYEDEKPVVEEIVDTEDRERFEYETNLLNSTKRFLYELINKIVDLCIEQEENTFLIKNLDKLKIMRAIIKRHELLDQERVIGKFVERRLVEYFKKKKMFQHIILDPPENIEKIMVKYEEAFARLDEALIRKKSTRDLKEKNVENLYEEKDEAEKDDAEKIHQFERLMRKAIIRDNSSKLQELVETKLKKMREMRNEISKMRLIIIRQQHLMGYYKKKFAEINDLGDGLLMSDYEYLRIKTDSLSKKLEERNKELRRSVIRFQMDMHAVAHIKGKEKIMKLLIQQLYEIYDNYNFEKTELRRELHTLKIKREIIRREISAINSRGGLLTRPMLMSDFDNTQDKIEETRQRIAKLKEIAGEYEEKLGKTIESL